MARIRITRELLEHLLDLPAENQISLTVPAHGVIVGGVECFVFTVGGDSPVLPADGGLWALQYEETDEGTSLVSAIPVPE